MAAARTAKQKAALRKAQLASAKKRKRRALVRNTGRGIVGKKNGSRKKRYKVARYAGGLAAAGALAYGHHKVRQHLKSNDYSLTVMHGKNNHKKRVEYKGVRLKDGSAAAMGTVRVGKKRYGASVKRIKRRR